MENPLEVDHPRTHHIRTIFQKFQIEIQKLKVQLFSIILPQIKLQVLQHMVIKPVPFQSAETKLMTYNSLLLLKEKQRIHSFQYP